MSGSRPHRSRILDQERNAGERTVGEPVGDGPAGTIDLHVDHRSDLIVGGRGPLQCEVEQLSGPHLPVARHWAKPRAS